MLVAGLAGGACSSADRNFPPPPPCEGPHCTVNPAGGSVPGPDGGPDGGGTGGSDAGNPSAGTVTGTVHRITNDAFDDLGATFNASATILALPPGAAMISAPYGGAAGTSFSLPGVPSGRTWFLVRDETSGGAGVLSTFSLVQLPALTAIALPVVDLGVLQNIASSLPAVSAKGVSPLAAQIVLLLSHANGPYKGVALSGGAAGAQIVYDLGPGAYTDAGSVTGAAGTIILFNAGLGGLSTLTLTDLTSMTTYQVSVQAAAGAATLVRADLE